jgi:hypothetical protein
MTAVNQAATPGRLGALFRTTNRRYQYNPNKDTNHDCAARIHEQTRVLARKGGVVRQHVASHTKIGSWWCRRGQRVTNMQRLTPQRMRISLQSCLHRSFPGADIVLKCEPRRAKEQFRSILVELRLPVWIRHRKIFNIRVHLDWGTRVRADCSMGMRNHGDSHLTRWGPVQGVQTTSQYQVPEDDCMGITMHACCGLLMSSLSLVASFKPTIHAGNFGTQITLPSDGFQKTPT